MENAGVQKACRARNDVALAGSAVHQKGYLKRHIVIAGCDFSTSPLDISEPAERVA